MTQQVGDSNSQTQRWERIWAIFEEILDAPQDARKDLFERLCGGDKQLRDEVEALVRADSAAPWFDNGVDDARRTVATDWAEQNDVFAVRAGERIGPWRLLHELGRGGMGVVWLAERADGQFEQRAALKLIKRGLDSDAVNRRFLRERQILARLDHPHIAHLLDGGIAADGSPYFAMEYVEGLPLLQYCLQREVKLEGRIRLFLDICAAVQFAHEHQVVHRDLKPSNVLVTRSAGIKLLDFGIAKLLGGDVGEAEAITQLQREQPMTPAYAAPEQIRGETISAATDIYALGCMLYELLSGHQVHDLRGARSANDVLRVIESSTPVAPSRSALAPVPRKRLRGDLDTIALTALKPDPERRYASVAALAADLQNHLAGRPIAARRDSVFYRGYTFVRRHRTGASAGAIVFATILIAVAMVWFERSTHASSRMNAALAIVDFHNLSPGKDEAWIAPALAEMLATELALGNRMHALPDELVRSVRDDLSAPVAGGYAQSTLAAVRKRLGADYVLSGSYLVSGAPGENQLRFDLALQDARTGAAVANVAQTGSLDDLPALIGKAGVSLREQSGYATPDPGEVKQTDKAQPPNTEVARRMGLALDALHQYDAARARTELLDVVAMSPGYAPAYVYLAQAWKALGYDAKALAAAQQAEAHSEGLSAEFRLRIGREAAVQKSDWTRAIQLDRELLALDAKNAELHLALIDDLTEAGKWDEVDKAFVELRALPGSEDDPRVDIKAARVAQMRGDAKAQAAFAQSAVRKAQARDEPALAAMARHRLAQAQDALGQQAQAEALFRSLVTENQRIGNPRGEANAHVELAIIADARNEPAASREEYESALQIYQRIGDLRGRGLVYNNLMLILWHQGDRDGAEAAAKRSLEIRRESGDLGGEGKILSSLAYLKMDEAATDDVMDDFRQAIAVDERAGARSQHIVALKNYSEGLRLRGELGKAQEVCVQAQAEVQSLTDPNYRMIVDVQCARLALDRGAMVDALAGFARAQASARDIGDAKTAANVDNILAQIEVARGDYVGARDRLTVAIGKFASGEVAIGEAIGQSLLALCQEALHRPAERDRAAARAGVLRSRITSRQQVFLVDLSLAQLRGMMGERDQAVATLRDLAQDAEKRHWLANALEARLAALQLLAKDHNAVAATLRGELQSAAQKHGFGWVLARLNAGNQP